MIYGFATSPCLAGTDLQRVKRNTSSWREGGEGTVAVILVRDDSGSGKDCGNADRKKGRGQERSQKETGLGFPG